MEEWREVEGWNGKYEVSNTGEVRNAWDNVPVAKVIAGIPQYWYVNLSGEYGRDLKRLHILVAKAFIPNPDNLPMVDHEDRDKLNNNLSNLRWVTRSQNQRNKDTNVIVQYHGEGRLFIEMCEELFEDDWFVAYKYLYQRMKYKQIDFQAALEDYYNLIEHGFVSLTVEWEGEEEYLNSLCDRLGVDYNKTKLSLSRGWDIWNAVYNIPPYHYYSFELKGESVDHWYPTKESFRLHHGRSVETLTKLLDLDYTFEQILSYTGTDYLHQTVRGVTGNIKELCTYFEASEGAVLTNMLRKGMTLEEALFTPRQRVKRLSVNGVYNSPKYWYESFGINPKSANRYKSDKKLTFKETFEHYGVDTSDMVISIV
jgi:hypothetical protein